MHTSYMRNNNYLVADAQGQTTIVEAGPRGAMIVHAPDGFAAITNHFQFNPHGRFANRPTNSEQRLYKLKEWFNKRNRGIGDDDVKAVLSDPGKGVFCSYPQGQVKADPIVTLWSWIAPLGESKIQLSEGKPSPGSYRAYDF